MFESGTVLMRGAGAVFSRATLTVLSSCTFTGNRGKPGTIDCAANGSNLRAEFVNCIVRDGPSPFTTFPLEKPRVNVTYSNVQAGWPGKGNIDVDPCFVEPGYWADPNDPNVALDPDNPEAVWVNGDYHLKSQAGHWDRSTETWVCDEVTSACIDAGDPNAPVGAEPFPNGAVVNQGADGGTAEASKSYFGEPACKTQIAGDINGDCRVDATDAHIAAAHLPKQAAALINAPPTVTLTTVEEGEAYDYPEHVLIGANAADSDGFVVSVRFFMEYSGDNKHGTAAATDNNSSDGWGYDWCWWVATGVPFEGPCVIWAEAMDDDGAVAVSSKITVSLHVTN
jgi:hypothetical protein